MKLLSFILATFFASAALAYPDGPHRQQHLTPSEIGISAAALDATVTSTSFKVRGWSQLTVTCYVNYTAATEIQLEFQHSVNWGGAGTSTVATNDANATWNPVMAGDITNVSNIFTDELDIYRAHRDISAADDWFTVSVPINYLRMRLVVTDTGGGASDDITCDAILGGM